MAPNPVLLALGDLSLGLTKLRQTHLDLAMAMIGDQPGTGGSKGCPYLRRMTEERVAFPLLREVLKEAAAVAGGTVGGQHLPPHQVLRELRCPCLRGVGGW